MELLSQAVITLIVVLAYDLLRRRRSEKHAKVERNTPTPVARAPEPALAAAPALSKPPVLTKAAEVLDAEIAAVIAAAVAAVLDDRHRILSVQSVSAPISHLNVWAFEGRLEIFSSHKMR
jgi:hypothetical protein